MISWQLQARPSAPSQIDANGVRLEAPGGNWKELLWGEPQPIRAASNCEKGKCSQLQWWGSCDCGVRSVRSGLSRGCHPGASRGCEMPELSFLQASKPGLEGVLCQCVLRRAACSVSRTAEKKLK